MKIFIAIAMALISVGARAQNVPEIHVHSLEKFAGDNFTVLYVTGREALIGASGHDIVSREVMAAAKFTIASGTGPVGLIVPAINIPQSGFSVANFVILVVHQQPSFFLSNPDGEVVKDARLSGTVKPGAIDLQFVKKSHIDLFKLLSLKASNQNFVDLDINKDVE